MFCPQPAHTHNSILVHRLKCASYLSLRTYDLEDRKSSTKSYMKLMKTGWQARYTQRHSSYSNPITDDFGGCAVYSVRLRPLASWDCGFQIPPRAWMPVSATSWSLVQQNPTEGECLIVCHLETSKMRRPKPELGCSATETKKKTFHHKSKACCRQAYPSFSLGTFLILRAASPFPFYTNIKWRKRDQTASTFHIMPAPNKGQTPV